MKNDKEIVESLIAGGFIGAALGALLSNNKGEGAALGALAGATLLATFKANEQAQKTKLPMLMEQDGNLYELEPSGNRKFIKVLEKSSVEVSTRFKLK